MVICRPIATKAPAPNAHDLLLKSLADPTRRALFERLCREGEQTVGILTARSEISQPNVSKPLRVLEHAGLVRARPHGREIHYRAQPQSLAPLVDWTTSMTGFWQKHFDKMDVKSCLVARRPDRHR